MVSDETLRVRHILVMSNLDTYGRRREYSDSHSRVIARLDSLAVLAWLGLACIDMIDLELDMVSKCVSDVGVRGSGR